MTDTNNRPLREDIDNAIDLMRKADAILIGRKTDARGDLDTLISSVQDLISETEAVADDICCTRCGAYNNDGEGEDGLCGNCADARASDDGEHEDRDHRPAVGEYARMKSVPDCTIEFSAIPELQPHLVGDVWTITDQYGEERFVEYDDGYWMIVHPDDLSASRYQLQALFIDDDAAWRGQILEDLEPSRSTAFLYGSVGEALSAARDLQRDPDARR